MIGLPPGVVVEVHDYDTDGSDAQLEVDEAGKAYALEVWARDLVQGAG